MANRKSSAVSEKRFACTFAGCSRAFTRQEHLQRHSQNHIGGDFTCDRCRAHFKRRDLLDRHVTRHVQKDAEGGSLMTRKRSWKDPDGNIVTKRPALSGRDSRNRADTHSSREPSLALMSPPISGGESNANANQAPQDDYNSSDDPWMFLPDNMELMDDPLNSLNTNDGFWETPKKIMETQASRENPENVLGEDVFNPDTASSFNMPFTTMSNYNWLFDMDLASAEAFPINDVRMDIFAQPQPNLIPNLQAQQNENDYFGSLGMLPSMNETPLVPVQSHPAISPRTSHDDLQGQGNPPLHTPISEKTTQMSTSSQVSTSSTSRRQSTQATSISNGSQHNSRQEQMLQTAIRQGSIERPMASLNPNMNFPTLDALARSQVLNLIAAVRPATPDGYFVTPDHPLLSLSALQTYCDLYFSRFNTAYPLIHQASFEPSKVETLLLISVLLLGATYCEKDSHQLAVCIHDVLRPQIFAHSSFSARPELWVLQTTLLVECFGKSRAGQKQHDMSHLFHGLLINLIRRSDCQTVRPEALIEGKRDLEDDWKAWIEAEQKKRLALLCFMWDTQHAVLFCQSLCMSAFELRSTLPCHQSLWEADSAEQWQKLRKQQKDPPLLLTVLKSYLTAQAPTTAQDLNALSRVLLLHGLMSIAWDMNRRDQTSLGIDGSNPIGDWKLRIAGAYDTWKADFDAYTTSGMCNLSSTYHQEARREFAVYATANSALYHAAHVILFSDFLDVQIYAGARHILGRPVARVDYSRSQRVVKRWANEQCSIASKAAWHAAKIIKDAATDLQDFDAGGLFIHPWCLYLATITIWSFHHARPSTKRVANLESDGEEEDDEMIWDAQEDMNALIGDITSGTPEQLVISAASNRNTRTAGLTAVIAKRLSKVRWAIVHDGMLVLKGLVPWRLISESDAVY